MKRKYNIGNIQNTFLRRLVTVMVMPFLVVISLIILIACIILAVLEAITDSVQRDAPAAWEFIAAASVYNWLGNEKASALRAARAEADRAARVARMQSRRQA